MKKLLLPLLLALAVSAEAAILRYNLRIVDSSASPDARVPQLIVADTEAECPSTDVGDGDLCYAKDTDVMRARANSAWVTFSISTHSHDIDAITGQGAWDTAASKTTADLTIDGVELDFEAGGAEGFPRLAQSATPPATACDAAAEVGRLYLDTDADTDGSVFICTGAGPAWKDIDDDGAGGGGGDNLRVEDGDNAGTFTAMVDADFDDSGDLNFTRAAGPPDVLTATVRPNSVELPTDTTGTYVGDVTAGTGIAVTGAPAENYTEMVAFDFSDAGADPGLAAGECRFSNEGASAAGWVCEGETADTIETRFRVTDPATADRIVTIPNADSTTVQPDTGAANNFLTAVSASGVVSKAQPAFTNLSGTASDAQVDGSLEADEVNPTLGTQTQGNYVAEVAAGLGLTESGSPAETATSTVSIDHGQTLAGNPALSADECVHVATATGGGLLCEGGTADTDEMLFLIPDLSESDTTHRLVTESATQTLTNKTIAAADNVVEADTGDSATGFFSAGAIEAARGGTADDTSATTGVPRIAAGNWTYDLVTSIPVCLPGSGNAVCHTWTNAPAAFTEAGGASANTRQFQTLSQYTQFRINACFNVAAVAGDIEIQCDTDGGFGSVSVLGQLTNPTTGCQQTAFASIPVNECATAAGVWIRLGLINGNTTEDPSAARITLDVK